MAVSTVAVPTLAATATTSTTSTTPGGLYGSGTLGSWANATRAISTVEQIQRVRETNGVYMFGDSISVQDGKALAIRLLNRDCSQMAVHNWSSRPTSGAVDALQQWASTYGLPRRILMASGSNDIFDPPKFAAQIDRAMGIVGPNRTLFWVNIQAVRKAQTATVQLADQRNSSWLNMQMYDAQEKYRIRALRGYIRIARQLQRLLRNAGSVSRWLDVLASIGLDRERARGWGVAHNLAWAWDERHGWLDEHVEEARRVLRAR